MSLRDAAALLLLERIEATKDLVENSACPPPHQPAAPPSTCARSPDLTALSEVVVSVRANPLRAGQTMYTAQATKQANRRDQPPSDGVKADSNR